jgi:hypothetical protein
MGQTIWDVLATNEGCWVAVTRDGKVVAKAGSLHEAARLVEEDRHRVTFLYAAGPANESEKGDARS